jgi:hypothetical protein
MGGRSERWKFFGAGNSLREGIDFEKETKENGNGIVERELS